MKRSPKPILLVIVLLAIVVGLLIIKKGRVDAPSLAVTNLDQTQATITKAKAFNKHKYSLTDPTSLWVVVNKQNPLKPIN